MKEICSGCNRIWLKTLFSDWNSFLRFQPELIEKRIWFRKKNLLRNKEFWFKTLFWYKIFFCDFSQIWLVNKESDSEKNWWFRNSFLRLGRIFLIDWINFISGFIVLELTVWCSENAWVNRRWGRRHSVHRSLRVPFASVFICHWLLQ